MPAHSWGGILFLDYPVVSADLPSCGIAYNPNNFLSARTNMVHFS
jgi:hypothetical protein